jgi:hypothetical protein
MKTGETGPGVFFQCLARRPQQPHDLDIVSGFWFKPLARLHPVQIPENVSFRENRGMA